MGDVNISDAEWQVMEVIWDRRSASAAEVIAELLPQTGWQHRTVRTLLARLVEKGVLAAAADGKRYIYRPLLSRNKCVRSKSQSFLNKVFAGNSAELLVHFVTAANISPEEIENLKHLLDEKRMRRE
jgi:BlaI family penicillinase repressor